LPTPSRIRYQDSSLDAAISAAFRSSRKREPAQNDAIETRRIIWVYVSPVRSPLCGRMARAVEPALSEAEGAGALAFEASAKEACLSRLSCLPRAQSRGASSKGAKSRGLLPSLDPGRPDDTPPPYDLGTTQSMQASVCHRMFHVKHSCAGPVRDRSHHHLAGDSEGRKMFHVKHFPGSGHEDLREVRHDDRLWGRECFT